MARTLAALNHPHIVTVYSVEEADRVRFLTMELVEGETPVELGYSILKDTPSSVTELRPELPRHLDRLLRLCLEKDPERRLQSAKDLRNQLQDLEAEVRSGSEVSAVEKGVTRSATARRRAIGLLGALAAAGLVVWGLLLWLQPATHEAFGSSLAVLPLKNLSGDPEQDFFADGLTNALITSLGQLGTLHVISRTSVLPYRDTPKPVTQIARELGVDLLLEGAVLRVGDRVRITAKLIEGAADRQLWAESEEARLAADGRSVDPEAYKAYLRGRHLWEQWRHEALWKSLEHYETAVGRDRSFAPAWVGLAEALWGLAFRGEIPPREAFARAQEAVEEALGLDPLAFWSNLRLGWSYFMAQRYEEALDRYHATRELFPGNTLIHRYIAWGLLEQRIDETGTGPHLQAAKVAEALGDRERAVELLEQAVARREPGFVVTIRGPRYAELRLDPRVAELMAGIGLPR